MAPAALRPHAKKKRKPLVEKERRARINESLQEIRLLTAEADMETAEVLEMTARRVESFLRTRSQEVEAVSRECFAAGYIQCMCDVHTFVSNCPGIAPSVATELLNHLLESMPSSDKDGVQLIAELPDWSQSESPCVSPGSPAPTATSSEDLSSDLEETKSERSLCSSSEELDAPCSSPCSSKPMWRPW